MDKCYSIQAPAGQGDGTTFAFGEAVRSWKMNKRVNIPLEFSGTTGVIGELKVNNIGVLVISAAGAVKMDYVCRIRYSDN